MTLDELKAALDLIPNKGEFNKERRREIIKQINRKMAGGAEDDTGK